MDNECPSCGEEEFGYGHGGMWICMSCYYTSDGNY